MKHLRISVEGKTYEVEVELLDETTSERAPATRAVRAATPAAQRAARPAATPAKTSSSPGDVVSPLAAVVISIDVKVGDVVSEGQNIVTLEAMKMNTMVSATASGTVQSINVSPGVAVEEGQVILNVS